MVFILSKVISRAGKTQYEGLIWPVGRILDTPDVDAYA